MSSRVFSKSVIAALAAVLSLSACGSGGPAESSAEGGDVRSVVHDSGTTDNVPAKPKRIVSLSVTLTGHLLALDAPVVATQAAPGPFSDETGFFLQWAEIAKERNVEVAYTGGEVDPEKVLAAKPDLIIGAASGADGAAKFYDQLKGIAPTLIYRYDNIPWQDLTRKLGDATGLADNAEKVLGDFDAKVGAAKEKLQPPAQDVALLRHNGTQVATFTRESAQGQLLGALGLNVHVVPEEVKGEGPEGGDRNDVVTVAQENLGPAFGDSSLFFVGHTPEQIAKTEGEPLWSSLPAVADKRVYDLGLDSFRMDYFSASSVVDKVEKVFAA